VFRFSFFFFRFSCSMFLVSGSGFRVTRFGLRLLGYGFGFRVVCCVFRVSAHVFRFPLGNSGVLRTPSCFFGSLRFSKNFRGISGDSGLVRVFTYQQQASGVFL